MDARDQIRDLRANQMALANAMKDAPASGNNTMSHRYFRNLVVYIALMQMAKKKDAGLDPVTGKPLQSVGDHVTKGAR
jgi:hypothetical protein